MKNLFLRHDQLSFHFIEVQLNDISTILAYFKIIIAARFFKLSFNIIGTE